MEEAAGVQFRQEEEQGATAHIWRSAPVQPALVGGTPCTSSDLLLQPFVFLWPRFSKRPFLCHRSALKSKCNDGTGKDSVRKGLKRDKEPRNHWNRECTEKMFSK